MNTKKAGNPLDQAFGIGKPAAVSVPSAQSSLITCIDPYEAIEELCNSFVEQRQPSVDAARFVVQSLARYLAGDGSDPSMDAAFEVSPRWGTIKKNRLQNKVAAAAANATGLSTLAAQSRALQAWGSGQSNPPPGMQSHLDALRVNDLVGISKRSMERKIQAGNDTK